MKPIITFIKSLQFIFKPKYWIMDNNYDASWDKKFCELAEAHDFMPEHINDPGEFGNKTYCALLGEYRVWVANYPYAFFSYCGKSNSSANLALGARPSRLTIDKYYKKLVKDLEKYNTVHR